MDGRAGPGRGCCPKIDAGLPTCTSMLRIECIPSRARSDVAMDGPGRYHVPALPASQLGWMYMAALPCLPLRARLPSVLSICYSGHRHRRHSRVQMHHGMSTARARWLMEGTERAQRERRSLAAQPIPCHPPIPTQYNPHACRHGATRPSLRPSPAPCTSSFPSASGSHLSVGSRQ